MSYLLLKEILHTQKLTGLKAETPFSNAYLNLNKTHSNFLKARNGPMNKTSSRTNTVFFLVSQIRPHPSRKLTEVFA